MSSLRCSSLGHHNNGCEALQVNHGIYSQYENVLIEQIETWKEGNGAETTLNLKFFIPVAHRFWSDQSQSRLFMLGHTLDTACVYTYIHTDQGLIGRGKGWGSGVDSRIVRLRSCSRLFNTQFGVVINSCTWAQGIKSFPFSFLPSHSSTLAVCVPMVLTHSRELCLIVCACVFEIVLTTCTWGVITSL